MPEFSWRNFIYTVDDPTAPAHTPKNKGREALPYLQFIIDHYHDLPTPIVFMHAHHDSWHVDTTDNVNFNSVRSLQRPFVEKQGFVNLRCQPSPGCPAEMQPFRNPPKPGNPGEAYYAAAWKELFGNTKVPQTIAAPCCSQFAVSRTQVLQRPLSDYQRMYNWVLNNDLPDEATANIMEYSWHIIFGQDPVLYVFPSVALIFIGLFVMWLLTFMQLPGCVPVLRGCFRRRSDSALNSILIRFSFIPFYPFYCSLHHHCPPRLTSLLLP